VTQLDGNSKVNFFVAALRMATRLLLGAFSFIFVLTSKKHQAFHDVIFRTLVVNKNPHTLAEFEVLAEREEAPSGFVQKSVIRRCVVIVVYCILVLLVVAIVHSLLVSDQCMRNGVCGANDNAIVMALSILLLLGVGLCIVQGWCGRLFGCRRVAKSA
jgi:hypothetical protein